MSNQGQGPGRAFDKEGKPKGAAKAAVEGHYMGTAAILHNNKAKRSELNKNRKNFVDYFIVIQIRLVAVRLRRPTKTLGTFKPSFLTNASSFLRRMPQQHTAHTGFK